MDEIDTVLASVDHAMSDKVQLRYTIDTLTLGSPGAFLFYTGKSVISIAECVLLTPNYTPGDTFTLNSMIEGSEDYLKKLVTYIDRFKQHMPLSLRQHLLHELLDS